MLQVQNEVRNMISRYHMISREDRVLIGVSGGADSTALLHVLVKLGGILRAKYRVVHVNHGIRGEEADRDARFVEAMCRKYRVPCRVVTVQAQQYAKEHRMSLEEAGRHLRYSVFEEEARAWEREADTHRPVKIAVAHNKEDNAETILMQLSRGSGLKGVAGMQPVRGRIIRPLLCVSRADIEAYLTKEETEWITDSTNLEDSYTRNRIRHDILPRLVEGVNRGAVDNITRAGRLIGEADAYLAKQAQAVLDRVAVRDEESAGVAVRDLLKEDPVIRAYMVRLMIGTVTRSMRNITARHVEDVLKLAGAGTGKRTDLPYELTAIRTYDMLWIGKKGFPEDQAASPAGAPDGVPTREMNEFYRKNFSFNVFDYDGSMDIPSGEDVKWFDYDKIDDIMEIRPRRTGDYIALPSGGRKTVKSLMIDEKIPAAGRDSVPLLAIGSNVLWVVGYRMGASCRVDGSTRRVFEVRYKGAENG